MSRSAGRRKRAPSGIASALSVSPSLRWAGHDEDFQSFVCGIANASAWSILPGLQLGDAA